MAELTQTPKRGDEKGNHVELKNLRVYTEFYILDYHCGFGKRSRRYLNDIKNVKRLCSYLKSSCLFLLQTGELCLHCLIIKRLTRESILSISFNNKECGYLSTIPTGVFVNKSYKRNK